jgi:inner membrane protein
VMVERKGFWRRLLAALRPRERGYELEDEDVDAYGHIVEVIEPVSPDDHKGRIAFRGSTWTATSATEPIPAGARARVVYRDNITWVVEPYDGPAPIGAVDV